LIVDDNRCLAEDLAEILQAEGFEVRVFFDPGAVVRVSEQLSFDVALLDLRMPGMDGVALYRALLNDHPDAAFVLMSAHAEEHQLGAALGEGIREVLSKPFSPSLLLAALGT
jgi:CheY-like chemotaxis protein